MNLRDLLHFDTIIIQIHNNPDADAIASGFALQRFLSKEGKKARLVFGGRGPLVKPSLQRLVDYLKIPLEHLPEADARVPDLLLLADCQYGGGNVMPMAGKQVAVIDHHVPENDQPELSIIRPDCGACASLVHDLLLHAGCIPDKAVNTALHYGLYIDTQCFAELRNALDRDLLEEENIDSDFVAELKKNNLALTDLHIAAETLKRIEYQADKSAAILHAPPCDPNLLGFLSDFVLQAEGVNLCLVWQQNEEGCKYSVRSAGREVKASDLATWLGSGGGHLNKAGGWVSNSVLSERHPAGTPEEYFRLRLAQYFEHYELIDCAAFAGLDPQELKPFRKLPLTLGYVPCAQAFPNAPAIYVRMLESDAIIQADAATLMMIGVTGEVYPIQADTFEKSYSRLDQPYVASLGYAPRAAEGRGKSGAIAPSALNLYAGRSVNLLQYARACKSKESKVLAKQLFRGVKVFTRWDPRRYMLGEAGDWLVARADDLSDIYVVRQDIFTRTYAPA